MSIPRWIWFAGSLFSLLVLQVSLWPLLPWWLAPALLPLIIVGTAIDGQLAASARWAIWGGLAFDLLAGGYPGVRWVSFLLVAIVARESRRLVAIREFPWLWPVWFGVGAGLANLPVGLLTQQLRLVVPYMLVAALWGPAILLFVHWFVQQKERA